MNNNMEILNEVYFGEQPELSQALIYLQLFREKYYGVIGALNMSWGSDKNLDKFNTCMKELFGFKSFYLDIYSNVIADAHTGTCRYSVGSYSRDNKIMRTSKGFKYNGLVSALVTISSSLIFNRKYNDREILAIILHETGHCFSNKISPVIDVEGKIVSALSFPIILIRFCKNPYIDYEQLLIYSDKLKELYMGMKQNEILGTIFNALQVSNNFLRNALVAIISSVPGIKFIYLKKGMPNIDMPIKYLDESIADNFATMYGFGPDLVSALDKVTTDTTKLKGVIYETPVVGWLASIADIAAEFTAQLFDVHPTISSRRKAQYNYLINEMSKEGIDPKLKKELMEEIDRMETCIRFIETNKGKIGGKLFYAKANELLDNLKRGDDIREYIFRFDKYLDKRYDSVEFEED